MEESWVVNTDPVVICMVAGKPESFKKDINALLVKESKLFDLSSEIEYIDISSKTDFKTLDSTSSAKIYPLNSDADCVVNYILASTRNLNKHLP